MTGLQLALLGVGIVATGWAAGTAANDPRPLAVLVVLAGAMFCIRYVEVAAAGLAFVIAANLSGVATNVHGLPSPGIALAAAIVIGILLRDDRRSFVPPPILVLLFVGYASVAGASLMWAGQPERTIEATDLLLRDMVLAGLIAIVVRRMGSLRLTLWAVAGAMAMLGSISTVQYLTGNFDTTYGGLSDAVVANIVTGTDDWRSVGPFDDPNYYAQMLSIGLAIVLNRALYEPRTSLRLLAVVFTAVTSVAVVFTFSRGGAFTVAVIIVVFLLLRRPRPTTVVVGIVVSVLLVLSLPAEFRDRAMATVDIGGESGPEDVAVRGRLSEVLAGAAMFRDAPLLGVGVANYPPTYQQYSQQFQLDTRRGERSAHSLYVEVAAESGVLGLTAFGAVLLGCAATLRRCRQFDRHAPPPASGLTEGLGLALLAFLTSSLFLHAAHARIFWLLAALALALPVTAGDEGPPDAPSDLDDRGEGDGASLTRLPAR